MVFCPRGHLGLLRLSSFPDLDPCQIFSCSLLQYPGQVKANDVSSSINTLPNARNLPYSLACADETYRSVGHSQSVRMLVAVAPLDHTTVSVCDGYVAVKFHHWNCFVTDESDFFRGISFPVITEMCRSPWKTSSRTCQKERDPRRSCRKLLPSAGSVSVRCCCASWGDGKPSRRAV